MITTPPRLFATSNRRTNKRRDKDEEIGPENSKKTKTKVTNGNGNTDNMSDNNSMHVNMSEHVNLLKQDVISLQNQFRSVAAAQDSSEIDINRILTRLQQWGSFAAG